MGSTLYAALHTALQDSSVSSGDRCSSHHVQGCIDLLLTPTDVLVDMKEQLANYLTEMNCSILMDEYLLSKLPVECAVWRVNTEKFQDRTIRILSDSANKTLAICSDEFFNRSIEQFSKRTVYNDLVDMLVSLNDSEGLVCAETAAALPAYLSFVGSACLEPMNGAPRRPIAIIDDLSLISTTSSSPIFPFPILSVQPTCDCTLRPLGLHMRTCHLCGYSGQLPLLSTCEQCNLVYYCSKTCYDKDENHKSQCDKLNHYKQLEPRLGEHPFSFSKETCSEAFDDQSLTEFLKFNGIFKLGMWLRESPMCFVCSTTPLYGELNTELDPYVLPLEGLTLEDLNIAPPSLPLTCWGDYYEWRGFAMDSPIAMLLHHVMTVYHIIQISKMAERPSLTLIITAVDKEADLVKTFLELCVLLPRITLNIVMVGPLISHGVSGSCFRRNNLTLTLYAMTIQEYLNVYGGHCNIDSIICLNAGLSAYSSWRDGVMEIIKRDIPCYVTDFCLLSLDLSQQALSTLASTLLLSEMSSMSMTDVQTTASSQTNSNHAGRIVQLSEPIINPFRDPKRKFCDSAKFPWFSNAFICELV